MTLNPDWGDLAGKVIGLGAPILGGALGGPLGAAAGKLLADALGAAEATPAAVDATLNASTIDPNAAGVDGKYLLSYTMNVKCNDAPKHAVNTINAAGGAWTATSSSAPLPQTPQEDVV